MIMNQNLLGEQCFHRRSSSGGSDGSDCIIKGEGEGGMIWENDILTCILSCELNRDRKSVV